jgi:hypothetical protein
VAVIGFDLHAPAQFGVVGLGVDEPSVRVAGTLDLFGVDDVASVRLKNVFGACGAG